MSGERNLLGNSVLRMDPTRTLALRKRFVADFKRRYRKVRKDITTTIVTNDAFGLVNPRDELGRIIKVHAAAPLRAFAFTTDAKKIEGFLDWLEEEIDLELLEVFSRDGRKILQRNEWMNGYIDSAYKQGISRGQKELNKAGYDVALMKTRAVEGALNQPIHAKAVASLYTRSFNELKGITAAMDQRISRSLATSFAEGRGPRQIARILNKEVDGVGRHRSILLARTETIRAHHVATINTYREAGVEGVSVLAEWSTAGDDRVCSICESLEGKVFTLDEIEGMIPAHPQCRCVAIPAGIGESKGRKGSDFTKAARGIFAGLRKAA